MTEPSQINPFQGPLWEMARNLIDNERTRANGVEVADVLPPAAYQQLVVAAARNRGISPEESLLLDILSRRSNVEAIATRLRSGEAFSPRGLAFDAPDLSLRRLRDRALAGRAIGLASQDGARVDRAALAVRSATDVTHPGSALDLTTPAGRLAIIDRFGQLAQFSPVGGTNSCGATSLMAVAILQGPDGVMALCQAILHEFPSDIQARGLLRELQGGAQHFPISRFLDVAQSFYNRLNERERRAGDQRDTVTFRTMEQFLAANRETLEPLFLTGSYLMGVDTDGDLTCNHYVAAVRDLDGSTVVFDPWEQHDGHHIRRGTAASPYFTASVRSFAVRDR